METYDDYLLVITNLQLQCVDYLNSIEKHLPKCRSNIMDVAENLSAAKKNEIQHLMHMVQLVSTICMHPHQFVLQVD